MLINLGSTFLTPGGSPPLHSNASDSSDSRSDASTQRCVTPGPYSKPGTKVAPLNPNPRPTKASALRVVASTNVVAQGTGAVDRKGDSLEIAPRSKVTHVTRTVSPPPAPVNVPLPQRRMVVPPRQPKPSAPVVAPLTWEAAATPAGAMLLATCAVAPSVPLSIADAAAAASELEAPASPANVKALASPVAVVHSMSRSRPPLEFRMVKRGVPWRGSYSRVLLVGGGRVATLEPSSRVETNCWLSPEVVRVQAERDADTYLVHLFVAPWPGAPEWAALRVTLAAPEETAKAAIGALGQMKKASRLA